MARLELKYPDYVSNAVCVLELIKKCDTNSDGDLDIWEIQELLKVLSQFSVFLINVEEILFLSVLTYIEYYFESRPRETTADNELSPPLDAARRRPGRYLGGRSVRPQAA